MGLFDKKYCDICGKEIGLLGNRKLEDGNMCKNCAAKLSHWFTGRKRTSVESIKEQLAYREENERKLKTFNAEKIIGDYYKFYIDETNKCFVVSNLNTRWRESNPDIIRFADVRDMRVNIREDKDEIYTKDAEGKRISYEPKRYEYEYEFYVHIDVNNPYFDDMEFKLNTEKPENPGDAKYMELVDMCKQVMAIICNKEYYDDRSDFDNPNCANNVSYTTYGNTEAQGEWFCPKCGSRNDGNFCVKCGTPKPVSAFEPFFCSKCGEKISDPETVFCPRCGNKVK